MKILRIELDKLFDSASVEERCRQLWDASGIHRYDANKVGTVFSVDTPPPYVSAAHLHVGHAMSYAQAEFIIRYQRMKGRKIFYPMGFDDNGLPTERYVEKTYGINRTTISRSEFRRLCLEETQKGAADYEHLWRALGLSVDWNLRYSTIDDRCRRTAQKSFIELYNKGLVYRSNEPVLWDPHFQTSLAQADLETVERASKLHEIVFYSDGNPLVIATTRPELVPACVALYCNRSDQRYEKLIGRIAQVPLFDYGVPILADDDVDREFGTGLMMVCTFGDSEDVKRWKRDNLETRIGIGPNGRMTAIAGEYEGKSVQQARETIVEALKQAGRYRGFKAVQQSVSVSERSGSPVEFQLVPQWMIRILDQKEELLRRSAELRWFPEWMKIRLDQWIEGLKYDWNISRQRFYGVPIPVWYCEGCGAVVTAEEHMLPVDPLEDRPAVERCPKCGEVNLRGESDVMDTWMTSSMTPLINANWAGSPGSFSTELYPMTIRVQAFEIIRTWLFYTLVKSNFHTASLPWQDVMISGWGLNEQGKKIAKKDLEKFTDKEGYNRYEPYGVIKKYGADALRYWAAGSHLGHDAKYNEKDVQAGRKIVVKLWNAARFCVMQLEDFDPDAQSPHFVDRTPEDRWLLTELNRVVGSMTESFDRYNYAGAKENLHRFFWAAFCDDYLEIIKDRFWTPTKYSALSRASAQATLWESLRSLLGLFAPFLPFVTEEIYQRIYQNVEGAVSLHVTAWPVFRVDRNSDVPEMSAVLAILRAVRSLRNSYRIGQTQPLQAVLLDLNDTSPELNSAIVSMEYSIQAAARSREVRYEKAGLRCDLEGIKVDIVASTKEQLAESGRGEEAQDSGL